MGNDALESCTELTTELLDIYDIELSEQRILRTVVWVLTKALGVAQLREFIVNSAGASGFEVDEQQFVQSLCEKHPLFLWANQRLQRIGAKIPDWDSNAILLCTMKRLPGIATVPGWERTLMTKEVALHISRSIYGLSVEDEEELDSGELEELREIYEKDPVLAIF